MNTHYGWIGHFKNGSKSIDDYVIVNVGDELHIEHGGTSVLDRNTGKYVHKTGTALFIVDRITKSCNIYGRKYNLDKTRTFNENYRLDLDRVKKFITADKQKESA